VKLVEPLRKLAAAHGATVAQVALAWLLSRGPDVVPIPGTSKIERLEENVGAAGLNIDKSALDALSAQVDAKAVSGTRYPAGQMHTVGV
jgi:aryl-alcohol dehydrogenase-like predicted oxidoreductase